MVSKDVIYDTLERRWHIAEAQGHNNPFEGPKLRVEGCCFDIFVIDSRTFYSVFSTLFLMYFSCCLLLVMGSCCLFLIFKMFW